MEEGPMKKSCLFFVILGFLVFSLAGVSYGWQGRMAGMGDPYGLVQDESDFLIHPAKIANGKGINFYGGYRFNYTGVNQWDSGFDVLTPAGVLTEDLPKKGSGDEQKHDALLGAAFPVGPGRMGLFFQYSGKRGDYDGRQVEWWLPANYYYDQYNLKSDLDDFSLRLLYGFPVGSFKLGGEFQLAYRQEKNKIMYTEDEHGWYTLWINSPWGKGALGGDQADFFPFMMPFDSRYWEALLKGSLEGTIGPTKIDFTMRGGFIFGGGNKYKYERQIPIGTPFDQFDLDGDVKGWQMGGDLWLRYPLANGLTLPFLLRMDYQKKTRDGEGVGLLGLSGINFEYENREKNLQIEVGGGVDKEFGKGTRIAAGLYYGFLKNKNDFLLSRTTPTSIMMGSNYDFSKYPNQTENRVILKLAGEKEISPMVALRMGLDFFYGWVREDYNSTYTTTGFFFNDSVPLDGHRWGVGAFLGGTVKFQRFTLEPFINAGYQQMNLKGDGERTITSGAIVNLLEMDKIRKEWSIGGGFSIKFN
jgi:hypothetical protein